MSQHLLETDSSFRAAQCVTVQMSLRRPWVLKLHVVPLPHPDQVKAKVLWTQASHLLLYHVLLKKSIFKICSTFHFKGALCHLEIKKQNKKDKCAPHGCVQIGPAHQDDAHRRPAANCPYALPQELTHAKLWVHGITLLETIAPNHKISF